MGEAGPRGGGSWWLNGGWWGNGGLIDGEWLISGWLLMVIDGYGYGWL